MNKIQTQYADRVAEIVAMTFDHDIPLSLVWEKSDALAAELKKLDYQWIYPFGSNRGVGMVMTSMQEIQKELRREKSAEGKAKLQLELDATMQQLQRLQLRAMVIRRTPGDAGSVGAGDDDMGNWA